MRLMLHVRSHLIRQVVRYHQNAIDVGRQGAEGPIQNRASLYGEQRLRRRQSVWAKPSTQPGRKDYRIHASFSGFCVSA